MTNNVFGWIEFAWVHKSQMNKYLGIYHQIKVTKVLGIQKILHIPV